MALPVESISPVGFFISRISQAIATVRFHTIIALILCEVNTWPIPDHLKFGSVNLLSIYKLHTYLVYSALLML